MRFLVFVVHPSGTWSDTMQGLPPPIIDQSWQKVAFFDRWIAPDLKSCVKLGNMLQTTLVRRIAKDCSMP